MIRYTLWVALLGCIVIAATEVAGSVWAVPFCVAVIGVGAVMWRVAP